MTWGQPPFYVHQMIHEHWRPRGHAVELAMPGVAPGSKFASGLVSAQSDDDGKSAVVRVVNAADSPLVLQIESTVLDLRRFTAATMHVLSADDLATANTPAEPEKVAPQQRAVDNAAAVTVPPHSFVLIELSAP